MVGEEVLSAKTILKPLSCDIISWLMDKEDWDLYMYTQFQNNVQTHTHCRASTHDTGKKSQQPPQLFVEASKELPCLSPKGFTLPCLEVSSCHFDGYWQLPSLRGTCPVWDNPGCPASQEIQSNG